MTRILHLLIHYRDARGVVRFADQLAKGANQDVAIVVVDNSASETRSVLEPALRAVGVQYWATALNRGYFGAAADALRQWLDGHPLPQWVIVSNTDMEDQNSSLYRSLFALSPEIASGVIGPSITSSRTHCDQNPYLEARPSVFRMRLYSVTFAHLWTYLMYARLAEVKRRVRAFASRTSTAQCAPRGIYAPHGSLIIFGHDYFARGGSLNYRPFLMGEELFVAETARRLQIAVRYEPSIRLIHNEHASTDRQPSAVRVRQLRESIEYCRDQWWS